MKKNKVSCAICNTVDNYSVLYEQNYKDDDFNVDIFSARRLPDKIHYQLVKCNSCGLVRSTPVIENDILNDLYVKSKLTYNTEVENLKTTYLEALSPILNRLAKKSAILEIGCGNGFVVEELCKQGYTNTFGIEPSIDAVEKAPDDLSKRIVLDYFKDGLFKENTFNFIFIFQTLDHIPNPDQFLKECHRVLKPNGYIFAYNHDVESISAKILGEKSPIFDIEHTFLYSTDTIKKIFNKNRFEVLSVDKPLNTLSLKHLTWLLPLPRRIKRWLLRSNSSLFNINIKIPLGNLAITARKK